MAIDLTLRNAKGSPLTFTELDNNFTELKQGFTDLADVNSAVLVGGVEASRLSQTVIQVAHIKALPVTGLVNNQQYSVASFYAGSDKGGGVFVWDATRTKVDHNGGTVIAPEALTAWSGTSTGIATLLNWAGTGTGCFVLDYKNDYVYAEWFGAIGYDTVEQADAGVDSTLQIYKAQQVAAVRLVDVYAVKDLQVTDKAVYMGNSSYLSRKYDSLKTDKPMLSAHSSCTTANKVIKCRDVKNWTVQGVNFDGRDRCPTIEGGAYRPTMIDVGIRGGLGNNLGDNLSPYTRGLHAVNITVREASVDNISCLVDSYINSAFISDAGRMNVNLLSGSGSNAFVGGKIEWCGQHGVNIYQSDNISFAGTIFDRCGYNAIRAVDSETITGNVILVRSGRNAQAQPAEYDSHLRVQGCKRVALLCVTRIYGDDGPNGGSGYISPRHTISSQNNESSCVLYGDLSGCTSKIYPEPEPSIDLSFCTGVKMEPNGKYKELLAGSSQTFALKGFDLNNFDHFIADVTVSCTDETTAQNNAGSFKLFVKRLDGSASIVDITRYYATDGNRVGSTGTPVFLVSATASSDASEITVNVASASANRNLVRVVSNMGTFNGF
jgi:hypothetical protein